MPGHGPLPIATNLKIADCLASGMTQVDTAKLIGIDKATVNYKAKALKAQIEALALNYFQANVPKATTINSQCLEAAQKLYNDYPPDQLSQHAPLLNQAHKISDRILQSVGIAPSLAPSVVVQQFVQVNQTTVINPQLAGMFSPASLAKLDAIDVDFEEMDEGLNDT